MNRNATFLADLDAFRKLPKGWPNAIEMRSTVLATPNTAYTFSINSSDAMPSMSEQMPFPPAERRNWLQLALS
jgi:hypothetical protein